MLELTTTTPPAAAPRPARPEPSMPRAEAAGRLRASEHSARRLVAVGEACGHRCLAHPDWTPCQRPPGHDPVYGHRDSAGTDVQHLWQHHSRG